MKIIVTGGAGFIASHIVDAYIHLGHSVVIVDNLTSGKKEFINKKATFYNADITDRVEIEKIFKREKPKIINHHAAQISVRNSTINPQHDASVNLLGLLNLLEAGRKNDVNKCILASSGGVVYGEAQVLPTPESYTPLLPLSPYGVTKLASELYLHYYFKTYGISYIALRYSNVYGPRQNPDGEGGVVAIFFKKLFKGLIPTIYDNGSQTRDYIFVEDVVRANVYCLNSNVNGSFNIGTGKQTNVNELYKMMKQYANSDIHAQYGPSKPGEQKKSSLETSLAKEKLGWEASVSLGDGLLKTVNYFRI